MRTIQRLAAGAAAFCVMVSPSQAQNLCTQGDDGRFVLGFDIRPSLVVNSDAVMDTTRGDLGLDGDASERAFSFSRTVGAILDSAGGPSDPAAQAAFVQTMIDSFQSNGQMLSPAAGILMPFDDRSEAVELSAAALLDDAGPQAMRPLALFNRFDLAPDNWSHCGEHRIVYGLTRPEPPTPLDRFLLIFEAMVPNPDPASGAAGCRRVAEFWGDLTGMSDADQAGALSAFYYDGVTGHPDGDLVDALGNPAPVVSFRNYGGDGGRGQVRANAFMELNWQLREWLTQPTFAATGPALAFVPVTVKDNPLAELYHDDIAGDAEIAANNVPAALTNLHGQFIQALTSTIAPRLLSEASAKHQQLVNGLASYDLGAGPAIDEPTILFSTIALGNEDKFNEHQSTSQGNSDVPGQPAAESVAITQLLDQVGALPNQHISAQTGQTLLNRALAGTCAGCHMTAPGATVRQDPASSPVVWPDVAQGGFVHVLEADRSLSPALEDDLLPVRRYVLGRYLCETLAPVTDVEPEPEPEEPQPTPYAAEIARRGLPVEAVTESARFVDEIVATYAEQAGGPAVRSGPGGMMEAVAGMSATERDALRTRVHDAIELARDVELQRPGAFYETRRPH